MPELYQNRKLHYRMYKAGKRWLFAGVMVITFGAGLTAMMPVVQADAQSVTQTTTIKQNSTSSSSSTASSTTSTSQEDSDKQSVASSTSVSSALSVASANSQSSVQSTDSTSTATSQSSAINKTSENSQNGSSATSKEAVTSSATGNQSAVSSSAQSSTNPSGTTVTSLANDATNADVATAKSVATQAYQADGTAQEIVRMDATTPSAATSTGVVSGSGYQEGSLDTMQYDQWTTLYKQGTTLGIVGLVPIGFVSPVYYLSGSYSEASDPAVDGVLGVTKHFSIFTFDSLNVQNISGNYRIAAGGNLTLSGSSGNTLSEYGDPQIIVGGTTVELNNSNPTGKIYVSNDATVWSNMWATGHKIYKTDTTTFFTAAKAYLAAESNAMSELQQTPGAVVTAPSSSNPNLTLTGVTGADEDVFVLNSADFPGTTFGSGAINITNVTNSSGGTAKIIINVIGDSVAIAGTTISVNGKTDADTAANVTWNMPDVVSLVTHNAALTGNILAPNATFYTDGSISNTGNIAVKTYGQAALNTFTTKYVDADDNAIHQSMTWAVNNSSSGKTKTVSPLVISGYESTGTPTVSLSSQDVIGSDGSVTVTYDQSSWATNTITFHYNKVATVVKAAADLTVKYVDENGDQLAADKTISNGTEGDTYTPADYQQVIPGYTLDTAKSDTLSGTLNAGSQVINQVYEPSAQTLPVTYVDQNGGVIHVADAVSGTTNGAYDATAKEIAIPGYTFEQVSNGALTGTFGVDSAGKLTTTPIELTYIGNDQDLKIHYVDENGNTIHDDELASGQTGNAYDVTNQELSIPGYTYKGISTGALTGTYTVDTNGTSTAPDVTMVYAANPQSVTIHYVDQDGSSIANDDSISGQTGLGYNATSKVENIDGYTFDSTKSSALTGTFSSTSTPAITLVYDKVVPKSGTVTVKYVDGTTNAELATSQTLTGNVGTSFSATAPTIPGYTVLDDSGLIGDFTEAAQTVTVTYELDDESAPVNYYLAGTKTALQPATSVSGKYGTTMPVTAPDIAGYQAVASSAPVNFTTATPAVNFYYTPISAASVTVQDVRTDGTVIDTRVLPSGTYGESYTTSPDSLVGYVWNQETPTNATGTYSLTPQTVTYTYDYQDGAPVTVNYVVNGSGQILATKTLTGTGHFGDVVTAEAATFPNYTLVGGQSAQTTRTLLDKPQTIEFLYDDTGARYVNVAYVHRVTNGDETEYVPVANATTTKVGYDQTYTTTPATVVGYYVQQGDAFGQTTGNWSSLDTDGEKNQVVYYYNADPENFNVTYKDTDGNDLFDLTPNNTASRVNAYYGLNYKITAPAITGYTVVSDAEATGTVGLNPSDINFVYAKDEKITTQFVDESGNQIADLVSQSVAYQKSYTTTPAVIEGYELVSTPANAKGNYIDATEQTVTYVYRKIVASATSVPTSVESEASQTSTPVSVESQASKTSTPVSVESEASQTSTPVSVESQASQTSTPVGVESQASQTSTPVIVESEASQTSTPVSVESQASQMSTPVIVESEASQTSTPVSVESEASQTSTPVSVESQASQTSTPVSVESQASQTSTPVSVESQASQTSTPVSVESQASQTSTPVSVESQASQTSTPVSVESQASQTSTPVSVESEASQTSTPVSVESEASQTSTPVSVESEASQTSTPVSVESQASQTSIPVSVESEASQTSTPVSVESQASQTSTPVSVESQASQTSIPVSVESQASQTSIPVSVESETSQTSTPVSVESQASQTSTPVSIESEASQTSTPVSVDSQASQTSTPVSVDSQASQTSTPVSVDSQASQTSTPVSVESEASQTSTPVSVDSQASQTSTPVSVESEASQTSTPVSVESQASQTSIPVSVESEASQTSTPVSVESQASQTSTPVSVESQASQTSIPVSVESQASQTSIPVSVESETSQTSTPVSVESQASQTSTPVSIESEASQTSTPVSVDSQASQTSTPVSVDSQASQTSTPVSVDSQASQTSTPVSVESEASQTSTPVSVDSQASQTSTPVSVESEASQTSTPVSVESEASQTSTPVSVDSQASQTSTPVSVESQASQTSTPVSVESQASQTSTPVSVESQASQTSTPVSVESQASQTSTPVSVESEASQTSTPVSVESQASQTSTPVSVESQASQTSTPVSVESEASQTSTPVSVESQASQTSTPVSVESEASQTSTPVSVDSQASQTSTPVSVESEASQTSTPVSVESQASQTSTPVSVESQASQTSTPVSVESQASQTSTPVSVESEASQTSTPVSVESQASQTSTPVSVESQASQTSTPVSVESEASQTSTPVSVESQASQTSTPVSVESEASQTSTPVSVDSQASQTSIPVPAESLTARVSTPTRFYPETSQVTVTEQPTIAMPGNTAQITPATPSWDPIKLILMDLGGHIIAVREVSGYTDTWAYIGDLIPAGYHLAPGESAWLLLNNVSPQTLRLVRDTDAVSSNLESSVSASTTAAASQTSIERVSLVSSTTKPSATSQTELPHTNESTQSTLQVIGLGLLSMLFGLFGWRKRRHDESND